MEMYLTYVLFVVCSVIQYGDNSFFSRLPSGFYARSSPQDCHSLNNTKKTSAHYKGTILFQFNSTIIISIAQSSRLIWFLAKYISIKHTNKPLFSTTKRHYQYNMTKRLKSYLIVVIVIKIIHFPADPRVDQNLSQRTWGISGEKDWHRMRH